MLKYQITQQKTMALEQIENVTAHLVMPRWLHTSIEYIELFTQGNGMKGHIDMNKE